MIANHPELSPEYQGIKGIMMDDAHKAPILSVLDCKSKGSTDLEIGTPSDWH